VMDFGFSLHYHFLLELLPVRIFHSGFLLPHVLPKSSYFTISDFREAMFMDPVLVALGEIPDG
jgi:hypothetical protein